MPAPVVTQRYPLTPFSSSEGGLEFETAWTRRSRFIPQALYMIDGGDTASI